MRKKESFPEHSLSYTLLPHPILAICFLKYIIAAFLRLEFRVVYNVLWKMDHLSLRTFSHEQQLLHKLHMMCYIHDTLHSAVGYYTYVNATLIYCLRVSHSSVSFHWKQDIDIWTDRNTEAQILSQFRCWILLPASSWLICCLQFVTSQSAEVWTFWLFVYVSDDLLWCGAPYHSSASPKPPKPTKWPTKIKYLKQITDLTVFLLPHSAPVLLKNPGLKPMTPELPLNQV